MKNKFVFSLFVLIIATLSACSPGRVIRPLDKDQATLSFCLGGPLIKFGEATTPIPFTSLAGSYGIDSGTTASVGIHTTSLLFGVIQSDIGLTQSISEPKKLLPGLSVSPVVNMMYDKWEGNFRIYPQFDVNLYWNTFSDKSFLYSGLTNWFEMRTVKAHGEKQKTHWIPAFYVGHTWSGKKMNYNLEVKYIAPFNSNENITVDYISFGKKGAVGVYVGISKNF
jgi:hypothetical protein